MTSAEINPTGRRVQRANWRIPGPSAFFAWLSIVALFFISHLGLAALGFAYETPGGSPLEKVAPGTYLAALAFIALFAERDPIALLDEIVRRHKGLILFTACWAMLFSYIYVYQGPPLTATFDTFLLPILLFTVLSRLGEIAKRNMAVFLHVFMALNALLGLAEFAGGFHMTPIVAQGLELTSEWRSSAFLGHPLVNATMASCYGTALLLGGGRDLPKWALAPTFLLQCAALAVFGGRFATVLFGAVLGLAFARTALQISAGKRFSVNAAAAGAIAVPLLITAVIILGADGFFDKFIMRFIEDEGSADTRVKMFDLLGQIPFHNLLVGADAEVVATLQRTTGIAFGIESFEIGFIAYYGILISVPFFIGLAAFCVTIARATRPGSGWVILYFMVLCSGSASLSGKGTLLGVFVVLVVILLRRPPRLARAPDSLAS